MPNHFIPSLIAIAALLSACATAQENPQYKYSTKYKGDSPYSTVASQSVTTSQEHRTSTHPVYAASTAGTTQHASYTRVNHECLRAETNRELLGGALGGTAGAIAGKKLIGGTKGTVIGAAIGGAAGFGIGDKSIRCDPIQVAVPQQQAVITPAYTPQAHPTAPTIIQAQSANAAHPTTTHRSVAASQPYVTETADINLGSTGTPGYHAVQAEAVEYDYSQNTVTTASTVIAAQSPVTNPTPSPVQLNHSQRSTEVLSSHIVTDGDTVYSLARTRCIGINDIRTLNALGSDYGIRIGQTLTLPASQC